MNEVVARFRAAGPRLGLKPRAAAGIALSWFDTRHWVSLMSTLIARREFRDGTELLPEMARLAGVLADRVPGAGTLAGLARVLDDERIIALDPGSGRGFRLTMSGVGDNFQLHTLLAGCLLDQLVPGEPLPSGWIGRATTDAPSGPPITRRFRLLDYAGAEIAPTGVPADIPEIDGVRVVVLEPPTELYYWTEGRLHAAMTPTFALEGELPPAEAFNWITRATTARTPAP